ncbi:MAG: DNA internalization-related competence protein ComEC/Rec2 [Thermodesulfobacteriota bacterium]
MDKSIQEPLEGFKLQNAPLLPVLIAFIFGILFSSEVSLPASRLLSLFGLSFFFSLLFVFKVPTLVRPSATLLFFFLGALFIAPYVRPYIPANHIINYVDKEKGTLGLRVEGTVKGRVETTSDGIRIYVDTEKIITKDGGRVPVTGLIRVSVKGKDINLRPGDRVRMMTKLRRPRNFSNPEGFDYEWWMGRRSIFVTGYLRSPELIVKLSGNNNRGNYIENIRETIKRRIEASDLEHGAVLAALVVGDKSGISDTTREAFQKTGTSHILAISGLHVGIVAYFSYLFILTIFRQSERLMLSVNIKKLAAGLSIIPVFFYGAVAGFSFSTERAVIMVTVCAIIYLTGRGRAYYNTVALAALVVLIISPWALWELSFQFSFIAVTGIIYIVPKLTLLFTATKDEEGVIKRGRKRSTRLSNSIKMTVFVSIAAVIATAPLAAYHFNRVSVVGILLNIVIIPIMGFLVVPLSLIGALLTPLSSSISGALFSVSNLLIGFAVEIITIFSKFNWSSFWVSRPTVFQLLLLYMLILSVFKVRARQYYSFILPVLLLVVISGSTLYERSLAGNPELKITILSVGQGEAAFARLPNGETMLIDGGGSMGSSFDIGERVISPFLRSRGIRTIDYMVLSHAQRDHMGGLEFIASNFNIGELWWPGVGSLASLSNVLNEKGIKTTVAGAESKVRKIGDVTIHFYNPHPDSIKKLGINDNSLVIKLSYNKRSILFTGDIGGKAEAQIIKRAGHEIKADVLKAPHHGSRYSSSNSFLNKVSPTIVVVSAGHANRFGFPSSEATRRYKKIGAKVLRTDLDGALTIRTDGEEVKVESHLTASESKSILKININNHQSSSNRLNP